jgi:hypothetical protein
VTSRRTPDLIALELLNCVEERKEATKWDLIKVLGNEAQFAIWIEGFFLPERVLLERKEGRHYFYKKTERGELFHALLKKGNIIKLFNRISGRRLK